MDHQDEMVRDHQATFEGFVKGAAYTIALSALTLILMAIFLI